MCCNYMHWTVTATPRFQYWVSIHCSPQCSHPCPLELSKIKLHHLRLWTARLLIIKKFELRLCWPAWRWKTRPSLGSAHFICNHVAFSRVAVKSKTYSWYGTVREKKLVQNNFWIAHYLRHHWRCSLRLNRLIRITFREFEHRLMWFEDSIALSTAWS